MISDDTGYSHNPRQEMLKYVSLSSKRILDVGCHTGNFAALINEQNGAEVWGIDSNPTAMAIAKGRLDVAITGTFDHDSPLPEGYFDAII